MTRLAIICCVAGVLSGAEELILPREGEKHSLWSPGRKFSGKVAYCPDGSYPFGVEASYRKDYLTSFRFRCSRMLEDGSWDEVVMSAETLTAKKDKTVSWIGNTIPWEFFGRRKNCDNSYEQCFDGVGFRLNETTSIFLDTKEGTVSPIEDLSGMTTSSGDASQTGYLVGFETAISIDSQYITDIRFYYRPLGYDEGPDLRVFADDDDIYFDKTTIAFGHNLGTPSACPLRNDDDHIPNVITYRFTDEGLTDFHIRCAPNDNMKTTIASAKILPNDYPLYHAIQCDNFISNVTLFVKNDETIKGFICNDNYDNVAGEITNMRVRLDGLAAVYGTAHSSFTYVPDKNATTINGLSLYGIKPACQ